MSGLFEDAEIIAIYTRAEAPRDGVLIDAGERARGGRLSVSGGTDGRRLGG